MVYDIIVGNVLILNQQMSIPGVYLSVSSQLTWNQLVAKNIRTRVSGNSLSWKQSVTVNRSVTNLSVNHHFSMISLGRRTPISLSIGNGFVIWHHLWTNPKTNLLEQLNWHQTVVVTKSKKTFSTLTWNQTVHAKLIRTRNVISTYSPNSHVTIFIPSRGTAFVLYSQTITPVSKVRFTFGAFTFQVRSPEFDNSTKLEFSRISRRSRGGDLIIYRDPSWPESIIQQMEFKLLSNKDRINFQTLFKLSLGELVTYLDYLGQSWTGIILNPSEPIVQYGIGDRWMTKIQLQGGRS